MMVSYMYENLIKFALLILKQTLTRTTERYLTVNSYISSQRYDDNINLINIRRFYLMNTIKRK